jgi:hypothetical protein
MDSAAASRLNHMSVSQSQSLSFQELSDWLTDAGYTKVRKVNAPKEFSFLGDIFTAWLPTGVGVRVLFDDEVVASIKVFDDRTETFVKTFYFPIPDFELVRKWKGKVSYYTRELPEGTVFCRIIGARRLATELNNYLRGNGFKWNSGYRNKSTKGWVATKTRAEIENILRIIGNMEYELVPYKQKENIRGRKI